VSQSKQKAPAFLLYARDFTSGTAHFSPAEVGAYMRCLCHQWDVGGVPADDTVRLARIVGTTVEETKSLWDVVSIKFEKRTDGLFWNRRLESVRSEKSAWVDQKRVAGKARAAKAQRGQRGRFTPCNASQIRKAVTPVTSAAGTSAGGPLVLPLDAPLVKNDRDHSVISPTDQRTTSDPLPLPDPDVRSTCTGTSEVLAASSVPAVPIEEQRPGGRDPAPRYALNPLKKFELTRAPADDGNYAVLVRLAHAVMEREGKSDPDCPDVIDAAKGEAAKLRIRYDPPVFNRALRSAAANRQRRSA
jgi:uncharacterized protein YdaU (DUF1376 family)